jgi:hypothetical protein
MRIDSTEHSCRAVAATCGEITRHTSLPVNTRNVTDTESGKERERERDGEETEGSGRERDGGTVPEGTLVEAAEYISPAQGSLDIWNSAQAILSKSYRIVLLSLQEMVQ